MHTLNRGRPLAYPSNHRTAGVWSQCVTRDTFLTSYSLTRWSTFLALPAPAWVPPQPQFTRQPVAHPPFDRLCPVDSRWDSKWGSGTSGPSKRTARISCRLPRRGSSSGRSPEGVSKFKRRVRNRPPTQKIGPKKNKEKDPGDAIKQISPLTRSFAIWRRGKLVEISAPGVISIRRGAGFRSCLFHRRGELLALFSPVWFWFRLGGRPSPIRVSARARARCGYDRLLDGGCGNFRLRGNWWVCDPFVWFESERLRSKEGVAGSWWLGLW